MSLLHRWVRCKNREEINECWSLILVWIHKKKYHAFTKWIGRPTPKSILVGTIINREKINVGLIIVDELLMRDRQEKNSLPFSVLITKLCETSRVPFRERTDVSITPASSNDIQKIKVYYLRDDVSQGSRRHTTTIKAFSGN